MPLKLDKIDMEVLKSMDKKAILAAAKNGHRFMVSKSVSRWKKVGVIAMVVFGFAYLMSPVDFIPDIIPVFGLMDDAAALVPMATTGVVQFIKNNAVKMAYNGLLDTLAKAEAEEAEQKTATPSKPPAKRPTAPPTQAQPAAKRPAVNR